MPEPLRTIYALATLALGLTWFFRYWGLAGHHAYRTSGTRTDAYGRELPSKTYHVMGGPIAIAIYTIFAFCVYKFAIEPQFATPGGMALVILAWIGNIPLAMYVARSTRFPQNVAGIMAAALGPLMTTALGLLQAKQTVPVASLEKVNAEPSPDAPAGETASPDDAHTAQLVVGDHPREASSLQQIFESAGVFGQSRPDRNEPNMWRASVVRPPSLGGYGVAAVASHVMGLLSDVHPFANELSALAAACASGAVFEREYAEALIRAVRAENPKGLGYLGRGMVLILDKDNPAKLQRQAHDYAALAGWEVLQIAAKLRAIPSRHLMQPGNHVYNNATPQIALVRFIASATEAGGYCARLIAVDRQHEIANLMARGKMALKQEYERAIAAVQSLGDTRKPLTDGWTI